MKTPVTLTLEELAELGERASAAADAQAKKAGLRVAGLERSLSFAESRERGAPHFSEVRIFIASSFDDLLAVAALRDVMAHVRPAGDWEFDKFDFVASHLLAVADDTAIGCIGMRYFADFTKLERLMVVPEFRSMNIGKALIKAALGVSLTKGYRKIYAQTPAELFELWLGTGFRPLDGAEPDPRHPHLVDMVVEGRRLEEASQNDLPKLFRFEEIWDLSSRPS